jgi:hypothetical protein
MGGEFLVPRHKMERRNRKYEEWEKERLEGCVMKRRRWEENQ